MRRIVTALVLLLCTISATARAADDNEKLTPEELVSRHLASVGAAEARAAARSRAATGAVAYRTITPGNSRLDGTAQLASDGKKMRWAFSFNNDVYTGEDVLFDGSKLMVAYLRTGSRSKLGDFIYARDVLMKEGLLGGTLSTGWPLLDVGSSKPKLRYAGLKKWEGQQVHELDYEPRKNTDVKIQLFFEPESYRHVGSQYTVIIPASTSTAGVASVRGAGASGVGTRDRRYVLKETFGKFQNTGGVVLPAQWSIDLAADGEFSFEYRWDLSFDKLANMPVDPNSFVGR